MINICAIYSFKIDRHWLLALGEQILLRDTANVNLIALSNIFSQDIRSAGSKVLLYLPDSGHCSSVDECKTR